jgi:hypothetical protein
VRTWGRLSVAWKWSRINRRPVLGQKPSAVSPVKIIRPSKVTRSRAYGHYVNFIIQWCHYTWMPQTSSSISHIHTKEPKEAWHGGLATSNSTKLVALDHPPWQYILSYRGMSSSKTSKMTQDSVRIKEFMGMEARSRTIVPVIVVMAARALPSGCQLREGHVQIPGAVLLNSNSV